MANGFLYSKVQPVQEQNPALTFLEENRKAKLQGIIDAKKARDKAYENLFSNMEDLDVEGAFLTDAVNTMDSVKAHKINLFRQWEAGNISESDYRLRQERLDQTPLKFNAIYQQVTSKLKELGEGDLDMNSDDIKELGLLSSSAKTVFDPKTGVIKVRYKTIGDKGEIIDTENTLDNLTKEVANMISTNKLDDSTDVVNKLYQNFRADIEKKPTSFLETTLKQGIDVGTTEQRFEDIFKSVFGEEQDLNNPYIIKNMVKELGGTRAAESLDDEDFRQIYSDTYNSLKNIPKSKIQKREEITRRNPPVTSGAKTDTSLDKMNTTYLTVSGTGGAPLKNTNVISNGEIVPVSGMGATFKLSDTQSTLDLSYNELSGGEEIKDSDATKVKVRSYFIDENTGDIYVQGLQDPRNFMREAFNKNSSQIEQAMKSIKTVTPYFKLNSVGADNFRAKVFAGKTSQEVLDYLRESAGVEQPQEQTGFNAEDFYKQYKGNK